MNITNMFHAIDTHVLGEGFRIITQSPFLLKGCDIHEKERLFQHEYVREKQLLLNEPRGHRGMNGCLILPSEKADFQVLFFTHDKVSTFKYEGLAASLTALFETGNITHKHTYSIETTKGVVELQAIMEKNQLIAIKFCNNVAEVIEETDGSATVSIDCDRNYIVEALPIHINEIGISSLQALTDYGSERLSALKDNSITLEGIIFTQKVSSNHYKTVTFENDGYIRRTPGIDSSVAFTITNKKNIQPEDTIVNESIFSSMLTSNLIPEQEGRCSFTCRPFVTGTHKFLFDEDDPLVKGFILK